MRASEQGHSLGRWLWAAAFVAALPFLRTVQMYLESAAGLHYSQVLRILLVPLALGYFLYLGATRRRRPWTSYPAIALVFACYIIAFSRLELPIEKVHYVTYSLVYWFIFRAWKPLYDRPLLPAAAWTLTVGAGVWDEVMQGLLAERYFDPADIATNAQAAGLGALLHYFTTRPGRSWAPAELRADLGLGLLSLAPWLLLLFPLYFIRLGAVHFVDGYYFFTTESTLLYVSVFIGLLLGFKGQVLWLGRRKRPKRRFVALCLPQLAGACAVAATIFIGFTLGYPFR